MKTRLALVASYDSIEGPWLRARGNETGVRVLGLGQGERIFMDIEANGSTKESVLLASEGTFSLPKAWNKVRFRKEGVGLKPTQVELLVDG